MLSFYKIINDKLIFVTRVKLEDSARTVVNKWQLSDCGSTCLIAFANPTLDNPDGFVAHWKREAVPFELRLVA